MKITLEVPDSTQAAFVNYIAKNDEFEMVMVSKAINSKALKAGYADLREYEVNSED